MLTFYEFSTNWPMIMAIRWCFPFFGSPSEVVTTIIMVLASKVIVRESEISNESEHSENFSININCKIQSNLLLTCHEFESYNVQYSLLASSHQLFHNFFTILLRNFDLFPGSPFCMVYRDPESIYPKCNPSTSIDSNRFSVFVLFPN